MRQGSGTEAGGRRQRGRESIENEVRSLSSVYRWGTSRLPRPSSPSGTSGGVSASNPPASVTKRSRRRRRRGNLNHDNDLDHGSSGAVVVDVDSSWQEATTAIVVGLGGVGGSDGGPDGGDSPIARRPDAPGYKKHEAGPIAEPILDTPARRRSSDPPLSDNGGRSGCGDVAKPRLSPALPPAGSGDVDDDVNAAGLPTSSVPLVDFGTGGEAGNAEHCPAREAACHQQSELVDGTDDLPRPGRRQQLPRRVAARSEGAGGGSNREPGADGCHGGGQGSETGHILPDRDLAGGHAEEDISGSDSDDAGVGRWNARGKNRPGQAAAPRKRRVTIEDDSEEGKEEGEEQEMAAAAASSEPKGPSKSVQGDGSADELAAGVATFAVLGGDGAATGVLEERFHPRNRRVVGIESYSDSDGGDHDPIRSSSAAAVACTPGVGRWRRQRKSAADGGDQRTTVRSPGASEDEYGLPLENDGTITAAIETGARGGGDLPVDGEGYSGGEKNTSAARGSDCCDSESGIGDYCSPDVAEEWNLGTGEGVTMGADPSSEGDNNTGDVGGNPTGGKGDGPIGDVLVEPGASGCGKPRSLGTDGPRGPVWLCGDSDDEGGEVKKQRGREITRRGIAGTTSWRRVVSESPDSNCSPTREELEETEGGSSDGAGAAAAAAARGDVLARARLFQDEVATTAAAPRARADDIFLDAEEGGDGSETREAREEEGSGGGGSFGSSGSEHSFGDDGAGHGTTSHTTTGRPLPRDRLPRNRPRRQQARRAISDGEGSDGSGGSDDLDQEGPAGGRTAGLDDGCSAVASRSPDDNVGGPPRRHPRGKRRVAPSAAFAVASEQSDDESPGREASEEPVGEASVAAGQGGGGRAPRGGARTAAAASSPSSCSCSSSSWSPITRKPAGRSLRSTDSKRNRRILYSSDECNSSSDDDSNDDGGGCDFDSPLLPSDDSRLAPPVARNVKNVSRPRVRGRGLSLSLYPVSTQPSPRRRQGGRGRGVRTERGAGVGGGGVEKERMRGSKHARADDSGVEGLTGAAFLRVRDRLTAKYFAEFNEGAFGGALSDVRVTWSTRLQSTAGVTKSLRRSNASGGFTYVSVVELSTKVLDSDTKLRQTLLHELCHAAAWVVDHKSKPPHGSHFWAWADCAKRAHPGVPVTTCHTYTINYKYRYVCVGPNPLENGEGRRPADAGGGCGAEIGRHSKSINVQTQVCGRCKGRLALFGTHNVDGKLQKPRAATGFSLFVKQRYAEVKMALPAGVKQQEVMKEISRQWAARGNRGSNRTSGDNQVDVGGGGRGAPPSPPTGAGSRGFGNSAGAKGAKAEGVCGGGAAASSGNKENLCLFDLT
eukprot:g17908.t1